MVDILSVVKSLSIKQCIFTHVDHSLMRTVCTLIAHAKKSIQYV